MSIHPLRPHPHPVPEHSAAFVKTGLSVSIQNARVTRAHSQISRRNSTLGRTVCDLDRDNRDKHIRVRAIGISFFLKPLVAGFIFTRWFLLSLRVRTTCHADPPSLILFLPLPSSRRL